MHATLSLAASCAALLFLAATGRSEPIPAPMLPIACPTITVTATVPCDFGAMTLDDSCTRTVTSAVHCGGHGPACAPPPTPTVTVTHNDDCSANDAMCATVALQRVCHIF